MRGAASHLHLDASCARVQRFHCAGNGPDFDVDAARSILACASPGPPGATYGTKLHVFGPSGVEADAALTEVVIDSLHRNRMARGVRFSPSGRSLSLLVDDQRVVRCTVPE
eukprot:1026306-Prymnesium_polylepis.2